MKQTLISTLSFLTIATLMSACSSQIADKIVPDLSSDPCSEIDEKVMRLNQFTEVVKSTSAFHLEEKATAISVPGITVSNNRKQMLRDAKRKYAEYAAERQNYGCKMPMSSATQTADNMRVAGNSTLSSDRCAVIDQKVMRLNQFTEVVKSTSAFHLEEKATALPVPGITVSNNRKQMLRDAKRKYAEYAEEHQREGCETPMSAFSGQMADKMEVADTATLSSEPSSDKKKKKMETDLFTTKANTATTIHAEENLVPAIKVSSNKDQVLKDLEKKDVEDPTEHQKNSIQTPMSAGTQTADKKEAVDVSSDSCDTINKELAELYEFMIMVKNTSAFHLEEKAEAMGVPGITVSTNKKKMLKDAEKRRAELSAEREKQGCTTP